MFWTVDVAPSVRRSRVPFFNRFASEMRLNLTVHEAFSLGVTVPPSLNTVLPALSTATRCGQFDADFAVTETTGGPNCSYVRLSAENVYTTLPLDVSPCGPLRLTANRFVFGTVAKLVAARHGSLATCTGLSLSTPFGSSFRKRSYQRVDRSRMCARSGPGNFEGECPKSPM